MQVSNQSLMCSNVMHITMQIQVRNFNSAPNRKQDDLSDLNRGMVVDVRRAGVSTLKAVDLQGFTRPSSLWSSDKMVQNDQTKVSSSCVDIGEVRGDCAHWFELSGSLK